MPQRHYAAYIIGLFPSIYDWAVNVSGRSPQQALDGFYSTTYPAGNDGFVGVLAWKRGSLLVSMIWVAMIVMVLDRKWVTATIWALVGAFFALFGIIHVPQAGFEFFNSPTYEQCWVREDGEASCWDYAEQWMFFVAYIIMAAHFAIIEVARRYTKDDTLLESLDDPSAHAFDDWFADAAKTQEEFEASRHMSLAVPNKGSHDEYIPKREMEDAANESSDEVDL